MAEMASAGMKWVALNVGDHFAEEWSVVRARAAEAGVDVIPWARCYTPAILAYLVSTANAWGCTRVIPNLEKYFDGVVWREPDLPPDVVADYLDANFEGEVGISTEAHTYNAVDWSPFTSRNYTVMLQMFWEDAKRDPADMAAWIAAEVAHARLFSGFTYVAVTYQTVRSDPTWYDRRGTFNLYTGDNVGAGNWVAWGQQ